VRRWLFPLVLGALLVVPGAGGTTLNEGWARVQEALEAGDAEALELGAEQFAALAKDLGVRRSTPYSRALLSWSENEGGPLAQAAARWAERLDPDSPDVSFHQARVDWDRRSYLAAARAYLRGCFLLSKSWSSRRLILISAIPLFLLALAGALVVGIVFQTVRFLPELFHDGWELGRLLFSRNNAIVFAAVVVLLPVFAGLGPLWLLAWLFVLCWSYLGTKDRITAGVFWLLALALVPLNEVWLHRGLRPAGAPAEAVSMILEQRADPAVVRELNDLGSAFDGSSSYHLVMAAVFRMHGEQLGAREHFQKAALLDDKDPRPLIFLGNLSFDDGNPLGAIEFYLKAAARDPKNPMVFYNLSKAYDRTYRFEEADRMQRKARKLNGGRDIGPGTVGLGDGLLQPSLGWGDLHRMRQEVGPDAWAAAGLAPRDLDARQLSLRPIPLAIFCTGLLGVLLVFARGRWMWKSTACARCGKVFCPRCKTATESEAYCSQCISVFLKRDTVAIEQHVVKVEQIRRREVIENLGRRLVAVVVPGSGEVLLGRWISGVLSTFLVLLFVLGAMLWLPVFILRVEPELSVLPVQLVLAGLAAAVWLRSIVVSWARR